VYVFFLASLFIDFKSKGIRWQDYLPSKHEALSSNSSAAKKKKKGKSRMPVAHAYNPSYSGGRNEDDCGSKPAPVNSS
jgi:hypothetical protein